MNVLANGPVKEKSKARSLGLSLHWFVLYTRLAGNLIWGCSWPLGPLGRGLPIYPTHPGRGLGHRRHTSLGDRRCEAMPALINLVPVWYRKEGKLHRFECNGVTSPAVNWSLVRPCPEKSDKWSLSCDWFASQAPDKWREVHIRQCLDDELISHIMKVIRPPLHSFLIRCHSQTQKKTFRILLPDSSQLLFTWKMSL